MLTALLLFVSITVSLSYISVCLYLSPGACACKSVWKLTRNKNDKWKRFNLIFSTLIIHSFFFFLENLPFIKIGRCETYVLWNWTRTCNTSFFRLGRCFCSLISRSKRILLYISKLDHIHFPSNISSHTAAQKRKKKWLNEYINSVWPAKDKIKNKDKNENLLDFIWSFL